MPKGTGGPSASDIVHYLKGVEFPCDKQDLIDFAEDSNAPDEVLFILQDLPDQDYSSMTEIMQGVAQVQ
jgi:hypothetical protein